MSINHRKNKLQHFLIVEYYTVKKMNEQRLYTTTWMTFPNRADQKKTDTSTYADCICKIFKNRQN